MTPANRATGAFHIRQSQEQNEFSLDHGYRFEYLHWAKEFMQYLSGGALLRQLKE